MILFNIDRRGILRAVTLALVLAHFASCIALLDPANDPGIDWQSIERSTLPIETDQRAILEGVYVVSEGSDQFGDTVVFRFSRSRLCLYSNTDVIFAEMAGGIQQGEYYFSGYLTTVRNGRSLLMHISSDTVNVPDRILRGTYGDGDGIAFRKVGEVHKPKAPFYLIAHRAGGRNSDRLLRSENSIEMMRFANILGANAIEIDIKRTKDNQLIVFHDETYSPRTIQGSYVFGDVRLFSLHDIQRYARLIYGEKIPTLKEMLRATIDSSDHELVWLDVKDAEVATEIIIEQREALDYAKQKGSSISIVFGIPTQEVLNAYNASPQKDSTPVLCELDADIARSLPTCVIWAPRWTNGTLSAEVERMHQDSILVVTWTLDVRDYMHQFLSESKMDGILTNYPCLLAGMYYGLSLR